MKQANAQTAEDISAKQSNSKKLITLLTAEVLEGRLIKQMMLNRMQIQKQLAYISDYVDA